MNSDNVSRVNRTEALQKNFQLFNRASAQLSAADQALQQHTTQLNQQICRLRQPGVAQQDQLAQRANRLTVLLDALPGGVIVLDGNGRVQECNPAACDLLDGPLHGEEWRKVVERLFEPLATTSGDALLRNGRMLDISTCPLGGEPGQIILFTDVTEMRSVQGRLNRHQRLSAMGEVAASLAHQMRTPLSTALLYTSHLNADNLPERQRKIYSHKILNGLRHLERQVNDMLGYAKGGHFANERVEVQALLDELYQLLGPQLQGCEFEVRGEGQHAVLIGNKVALLGVLQNLLVNAVEACRKISGTFVPRLTLTIEPAPRKDGIEMIDICVSDNGPGITDAVQKQIFDPFYTTRAQGTGLGLAIVKAVVQAHNGALWVESAPGAGSTFAMRLPVAATPESDVMDDGIGDETSATPSTTAFDTCGSIS